MTKVPEAGRVKTRLIPALGADAAARLHGELLRHTLQMASLHAAHSQVEIEVQCAGLQAKLDSLFDEIQLVRPQTDGDLGQRIQAAIANAFTEGAQAVIVIGTDCPDISPDLLDDVWQLLTRSEAVIGPADDGGYYLIGLSRLCPQLFEGVDWGTSKVLKQTIDRCAQQRLRWTLYARPLSDVDEPENLVVCRRFPHAFTATFPAVRPGLLSVVVPALNEAGNLEATLAPILRRSDCEVIVADGGSTDGTPDLAARLGCQVVPSNPGRGKQLNAGAAMTRGELLLFLHADTRLPASFREEIDSVLKSGAIAGAFRFQTDHPDWLMRCIELGANWRSKFLQLPYGDQGLFLRSSDFFRLGGFRNWPLMEDFEFCQRLRRAGRIRMAPSAAITSGRRWQRHGIIRTTARNQCCVAMYMLGFQPEQIRNFYSGKQQLTR